MKYFLLIPALLLSTPLPSLAAKLHCENKVQKAAVEKLLGKPPKSGFKVLDVHALGLANKKLGGLRLDLYTVEIADEGDGGIMVVFTKSGTCEIHDVVFGSHALSR